jgi:putative NIF3 family GTP cyclohydrolase 1 type 2
VRLADIYRIAIEKGMAEDKRDQAEIDALLDKTKKAYDKLDEDDKAFFDTEKLTNPYVDTRINVGDPDLEVRALLVGVDMQVGEMLLADRLRDKGQPIDLVLAHHPEGSSFAELHEVMGMQADLWAAQGVSVAAGDSLMAPRAQEVRRRIMPANHYQAVQAAELLGLAVMSCHTAADNCVNAFVQRHLDDAEPTTLEEVVKSLRAIPEYADAARKGYGPTIIQGSSGARAGRIVVDMTGGTEGPEGALERLAHAGVGTLVGMHYSEEHRKKAEKLNLNLVIAGHVSSDVLGMNLILDEVVKAGVLEIVCTSGMVRIDRT